MVQFECIVITKCTNTFRGKLLSVVKLLLFATKFITLGYYQENAVHRCDIFLFTSFVLAGANIRRWSKLSDLSVDYFVN